MDLIVRLFEEDGTFENQQEMVQGIANIALRPSATEAEIIENAKDAQFIICGYEQITENVLKNLPNLKMVVFQSIGVNGIDMQAANAINMPVANISQYCVEEVADYVVACIMADNRKLVQYNDSVKEEGKWEYDLFPGVRRLNTQTVGLLGFGNIPKLVREKLRAFGCEVLAYDPFVDDAVFESLDVKKASMEEVFENSDYISVHLPLNPATENILDATYFNLAKNKPAFINSARGGVIDEPALLAALDKDLLSYAYLDVLKNEYPDLATEPLVMHPKTLVTPHSAFYSQDSMAQAGSDAVQNIIHFINQDFDQIDMVNRRNITLKGDQ